MLLRALSVYSLVNTCSLSFRVNIKLLLFSVFWTTPSYFFFLLEIACNIKNTIKVRFYNGNLLDTLNPGTPCQLPAVTLCSPYTIFKSLYFLPLRQICYKSTQISLSKHTTSVSPLRMQYNRVKVQVANEHWYLASWPAQMWCTTWKSLNLFLKFQDGPLDINLFLKRE